MSQITPVVVPPLGGSTVSLDKTDAEYQLETIDQHQTAGEDPPKPDVTYEDAARAEDFEHSIGLWQSIKIYRAVRETSWGRH